MKKLHKILTLALALIMILGVMAVPASAVVGEYGEYIVWTQDELFDLSIPRPDTEGRHVEIYIVPAENGYDEIVKAIGLTSETRSKYVGNATCYAIDERDGDYDENFYPEVIESAREAYERNTDPVWKAAIAKAFYLDTANAEKPSTPTKPEPTKPETPVTPPTTTTPTTPVSTGKVTSFSDVKQGDWYYEAVTALANSGIVVGFADGTFRPNQTITAGELATIICRIYGTDLSQPVQRLTTKHINHDDSTVNTGHWAESAIYNAGIYSGGGDVWRMCIANMEVNRGWAIGELSAAIINGVWPDETKLSAPTIEERQAIIAKIPDVASGASYSYTSNEDPSHYANYRLTKAPEFSAVSTGEEVIAHDYMTMAYSTAGSGCDLTAWNAYRIANAYHIGLVNGVDSTGRCDPWAPVTRAQVVQMLYNMGITYAGQLTHEERDSSGLMFGFGF